jgi:hypothetical protein
MEAKKKPKLKNKIEKKITDSVEKELEVESKFNLKDVILMFSIIGGTIGTTIALGSNELAKSLSENIINPFLDLTITRTFGLDYLKIKIGGSRV